MAVNLAKVARPPGVHPVAVGDGFRAYDYVCALGRHSRPSTGVFARHRVGVELTGTFVARTSLGDAMSAPNALLVGSRGGAYEFRHVDDGGDHSLVFEYEDSFVDEIDRGAFRRAAVPGSPSTIHAAVLAHDVVRDPDPEIVLEAALVFAGIALAAGTPRSAPPRTIYAPRVARTLRYIAANSAEDCTLATLAREARLTRYQFLRVFAALTGQTPRQHVIATRLCAAAIALRETRDPVTDIAFRVGFGDLSHFTRSFHRTFSASPRNFRKA